MLSTPCQRRHTTANVSDQRFLGDKQVQNARRSSRFRPGEVGEGHLSESFKAPGPCRLG